VRSLMRQWKDVTICDNFMFQHIMLNKQICKRFLELLLCKEIADIEYPENEKQIDIRKKSKSVRLDVYVTDTKGNKYDVEMQTTDYPNDELAKRTRYYQSMIDADTLKKGKHYSELKETYIIFVCTFDPFKKGRRLYTFRNYCKEDKKLEMGDGSTKIFLNSQGKGDKIDRDVEAFLNLMKGRKPKGKFAKSIEDEFVKLSENKEMEVDYMTYAEALYEERRLGVSEGRAEGEARGRAEGKTEAAISMLKDDMPVKLIMKYTQLSMATIKKLAKNIGVAVVL